MCQPHPWLFIAWVFEFSCCGQLQHSCLSLHHTSSGWFGEGPAPQDSVSLQPDASGRPQSTRFTTNKCHIYLSSVCVCMYSTSKVYLYVCIQMCTHIFSELLETMFQTSLHIMPEFFSISHPTTSLSTGLLSMPQQLNPDAVTLNNAQLKSLHRPYK